VSAIGSAARARETGAVRATPRATIAGRRRIAGWCSLRRSRVGSRLPRTEALAGGARLCLRRVSSVTLKRAASSGTTGGTSPNDRQTRTLAFLGQSRVAGLDPGSLPDSVVARQPALRSSVAAWVGALLLAAGEAPADAAREACARRIACAPVDDRCAVFATAPCDPADLHGADRPRGTPPGAAPREACARIELHARVAVGAIAGLGRAVPASVLLACLGSWEPRVDARVGRRLRGRVGRRRGGVASAAGANHERERGSEESEQG
jgi:hypothetical protein